MASTRLSYLAVAPETTVAAAVKPSKFLRFKDWDMNKGLTIEENNPIQNQRWNPINPVKTTESSEASYNFDLDPNDAVHFLRVALGSMSSSDISSATDASVFQHTLNMANTLPALSIEQGKGNLTDTSNNRQNYQVDRAFGAMVDTFVLSASDGIINMEVNLKTHGVFQSTPLIADAGSGSSVVIKLDAVGWLTTSDTVNIFDNTPQNETDAIASISSLNKTITIATLGNSYTVANEAKVELTPQTPSYTKPAKVLTFADVRFQFGADLTAAASAAEENIEDRSFTYENQLEERYGSLRRSPSVIAPKGAKAMISYSKYFENVEDRDRFLQTKKRACILTITNNEIVSSTDTNQALYTIKILLNTVVFTTYEMPTGTDELYAYNVEATAFYNESDGKAIEIQVINSNAGTVYTTA